MEIKDLLIRFNDASLPNNFVSIATKIVDKEACHAAILIRHKSENYLHHFPGNTPPILIENFNEDGWYIYKIWEVISQDDENEVGAFLQHCRRVCKKTSIIYSYIADGSQHKNDGNFESKSGLPELGTCVSFCVNTLSSTIIDSKTYFHLEDWDDSNIIVQIDEWSKAQVKKKYPDLDWTLYNAFRKRITPLEYLCSAFFENKYPIKKEDVLSIQAEVSEAIKDKFIIN